MFQSSVNFISFFFLISWGNVINIKISTTKLPLRYVPPFFFNAIYVPLIEYHRGGFVQLGWYRYLNQLTDYNPGMLN